MDGTAQNEKKLKELQKYVPFLEGIIKKLEAYPSNSREAQLIKMKQLHGLLTGPPHKLKPGILEKCESVLITLQGKLTSVTLPKSDLEISLAKLKSANKIEKSSSKNHYDRQQSKHLINKDSVSMKSKETKTSIDYKDHDYRPHEELQGNLYQRRNYRASHEHVSIKNEYPRPSSSDSSQNNNKSNMEDVLRKPPLSADDISNLLHETTDDDDENLDSKDINELYKMQHNLVDKMKKENDHGLVDNDYTGYNRLAFKYPRKKIDPMLSPVSSGGTDCESSDQTKSIIHPKPSSIYANITTLSPLPQYSVDNTYMKQEWFPQTQLNTPPIHNLSSMQMQQNMPAAYANDPRLRQKMQQQQLKNQPQPLLNNTNNYYPWYQNNMVAHNQIPTQHQSAYYMQQQQHQQQFQQQQMPWGSSATSTSTLFTDQKPHLNFNQSYNSRFNNGDRTVLIGKSFDESYKKFHPKLNDMVERKIYEKSKKSQHNQNNIPVNLLEAPKFDKNKLKTTIVHDISADDWISDELQKEKQSKLNEKEETVKTQEKDQQSSKEKILETEAREINKTKDKTDNNDKQVSKEKDKKGRNKDIIDLDNDSTPELPKNSNGETEQSNVPTNVETKSNDTSKQEDKITKEWIETILINLFKPNKSTDDSSSNILGLLSKVIDENKFNQIKTILQDDTSSQVEQSAPQSQNKTNENNSEEIISCNKSISPTTSVAGGDDEKDSSEKEDVSDNTEKLQEPRKLRIHRRNELDKLNLDIRNMFICEGVLTSTGRRMCTILKDNAYTEPSEKDKKNSVQNNSNKKIEGDNLRITRKNATKNLSIVVPKITLNKDHLQLDENKLNNKIVTKPQNGIRTKSMTFRQKPRKRNRGKQWASGVIIKKQPKRKQTNDEDDAEKQTNDDGNGSADKTVDKRTVDDDDDGVETEVENNIPDDRSSISDFSEYSVAPVATKAVSPKTIKNVDKNYYCGNTTSNQCVLCSKACSMQRMPKHYVSKHNGYEVFISRLNPKVADIFKNNLEERSGTRTFHKLRPVIKFSCYFCDSLCFLSVEHWISHIASHTGEYLRKCTKCPWQSAFGYFHQCTKKGTDVVINDFNFNGNHFYGYLCSKCNYVQLKEESVIKHVKQEHDSSETDIKILKINLINVPPVKIIKRGRKKLSSIESVEPPIPKVLAPIEKPIVLRSATRSSVLIAEPKIEPTESILPSDVESNKIFHAKEKEIIGEMEMRKNSSNSIVDRLEARFKENIVGTPTKENNITNSEEKDQLLVSNLNETLKQVENTIIQVAPTKDSAGDDVDNKSNDSEWEDLDDAHSCDSNTSISKLQAEIETTSAKPGSLTNTLVRLLDKIKAVPEKRKSPPSPENDECSAKKNRIDFSDILKQTETVQPEIKTIESETCENTNNKTNDTQNSSELIKIKEEFDESVQIKIEPQCHETEQQDSVLFRIERMGYKIKQNTFPQAYIFLCLFEDCEFITTNSSEFTSHINAKKTEFWDGFCYICESYVRADENMSLNLELKHMLEVHLKMNISINVDELVKAPTLSLKKLPGDLLSSCLHNRMSLAPSENLSEMLLIKPWTGYNNLKTHANCEEMLKEINLSNLYKCMGINCNFNTSGVIDYLKHLENHEKYAEDQLIINPCNLDTSSWLECPYCEKFADTYCDLVQHVTEKHKNSFYQCGYCFYRSFLATNVVMHRYKHHNDLPLSVLLCDKMENLPKINFEKILISRTSNIRALHCNIESCKNKKFYALDLFLNHHTKHNQNRYLCEFCSMSVDSQAILSHLVAHGIGLFECIYCRFATNKIKKIQVHMCDKHPTKLLFITLRIFRHPETNSMPHDIAGDICSIYLVNFGQRLTINFTQIHSTVVNNKSLDLLENERPKKFPSTFESGCLLNIAECNKLIAGSSVQILEINSSGSAIPIKPAFGSNNTNQTTLDTIETPEVEQPRNINSSTDNITVAKKNTPLQRLSIISAVSLLPPISNIDKLANTTATYDSSSVPSTSLSLMPIASASTTSSMSVATAVSITEITNPITIITPTVADPKESSSEAVTISKTSIIHKENTIVPNTEMPAPTVIVQKKSGGKEITEEHLEEIAKKISVDAILSKNAKFPCIIPGCNTIKISYYTLNHHLLEHISKSNKPFMCYFCNKEHANTQALVVHLSTHTYRFFCYYCSFKSPLYRITLNHVNEVHKIQAVISKPITKSAGNGAQEIFVIAPRNITDENFTQYKYELVEKYNRETRINQHCYNPEDITSLPREEIFLNEIFCSVCKYGTKVRKNMERHLMFHLNEVPVPKIDPINPVPCLSTSERHFDKMKNLACSSQEDRDRLKLIVNSPRYVTETQRFTCGAYNCQYLSIDENMLNCHLKTLHYTEKVFKCVHCNPIQNFDCPDNYVNHLRLHDSRLFKCGMCDYYNTQRQNIEKHFSETHKSNLTSIVVIREEATASTNSVPNVTFNNSESNNSSVINNSNSLTWVCNSCSFVSSTKKQVIDHNSNSHSFKSQFLCKTCGYRSNVRANVQYHLVKKHPDVDENQIFTTYSRSDDPESNFVDNSPIWRRDSNRVKSIRGILFEDEEMAANSDSNTETILSDQEKESDELNEAETTGMFCCNYCNYMASYRCVKMHHNEKHKDRDFKKKRTNLTTTTCPDKSESNDEKIKTSMTMYLCAYCPLRHRSIKKILEHWKDKHQHPKVKSNKANTRPLPFQFRITRLVRCYYCHEKYGYHELARHVPKRHPDLPIVSQHYLSPKRCGECDFKCEFSETDLVAHSKSEHADSKCRTIPSELLLDSVLSRYINMDVEQFYICTGCNIESDSRAELEYHLKRCQKDKPSSKIELKASRLMYLCSYCKHSSSDEFSIMKHIMKFHSPSSEKSPSTKIFYNAMRFKNNIDKFDQIKLIFPNGLVLNKADVVKTPYGGYDHIIKHLSNFDMPSPLSKKRRYDAVSESSTDQGEVSRLQPDDIKRLKFSEHNQSGVKPIESYNLSKIYTVMQIGDKPVRITCEKFAALVDINPVLKLHRV